MTIAELRKINDWEDLTIDILSETEYLLVRLYLDDYPRKDIAMFLRTTEDDIANKLIYIERKLNDNTIIHTVECGLWWVEKYTTLPVEEKIYLQELLTPAGYKAVNDYSCRRPYIKEDLDAAIEVIRNNLKK